MKYHFKRPCCNTSTFKEWGNCGKRFNCSQCGNVYKVPSPKEQPTAYVDTHEWPDLMEEQVYAAKGRVCTVPECSKRAETLDHRIAYSKGGKTSFENLWPMCEKHNQSKGDKDYQTWLYE